MLLEAPTRSFFAHPAFRYGAAFALTSAAASVHWIIAPLREFKALPFIGAVAIAARWLGFGPALFCTALSAFFLDYLFAAPPFTFATDQVGIIRIVGFIAVAILIASVARQRSIAESIARRFGREKQATLEALADRDERLRIGLTAAGMGTWRWEIDSDHDMRDASFNSMLGLAAAETIQPASDFFARLYPEDRENVERAVKEAIDHDKEYEVEFRLRRADGNYIWVRDKGRVFRDVHGKPLYITGAVIDITDRKIEQEELRLSRERFKRLFDVNLVGVCFWTTDGKIIEANDEFLRIVGRTRKEFEEQGSIEWESLNPPEYKDLDAKVLAECNERGASSIHEKDFIRSDGSRVPVMVGIAFLTGSRSDGIAFVMDVTERKRAEAVLLRQEKLASAGRLAATIAHEINNPLEAVTNLLYLVRQDASVPPHLAPMLKTADEELQRVTHTAKQTLGFYRESSQPHDVDLAKAIEEVLSIYARKLEHRKIRVQMEFRAQPVVHALGGELRQVFSNIVNNAADAMPGGGTLRVRLSHAPNGPVPFVRVTIADQGTGITREQLPHIFEPFFTTKRDVGTGLGLWVCKQLVEKHGGRIRVRSWTVPNHSGTAFSIVPPESVPRGTRAAA